jgi:dTDP-glucose pyrophosphorylase
VNPKLVILAAGAGTRYGGLKQLAAIGPSGETLLEYSACDARRAGFESVVLVIRQEHEAAFRARLEGGMGRFLPISYVHQSSAEISGREPRSGARMKPWGTAEALLAARSEIDGAFAVINADDFYGAESYAALYGFLTRQHGAGRELAALGFHVGETLTRSGPVSRAILDVDGSGYLRKIAELLEVWREGDEILFRDEQGRRRALSGDELVSMNMWGLDQRVLLELEKEFLRFLDEFGDSSEAEFILPEAIQTLVQEGSFRVRVLPGSREWCGITFNEDRERVRKIIFRLVREGRYPEKLWA